MAGIVVVVGEDVVVVNDEDGDVVGEKDAGPCEKEGQRTWRAVDSARVVVDVAVAVVEAAVVVTDVTSAVEDAVEDEFDPKDPVEEVRRVEALEMGMGLNESVAGDAAYGRRADGLVCRHAGREYIQDEQKRPWDGAGSGPGMEDEVDEKAVPVIPTELGYKN